jgi:glycosyltransferase involved in cell wall biosynthesis
LKILIVSGKYLPGKTGGIENYCHLLATILQQNNHSVEVAVLDSAGMKPYHFESVHVIPLTKGFKSFSALLKERHYDICHIHEYSGLGGIGLFWFKEAKQYCKKVFFTFHLPYLTCYKNDLRYMGTEDCNDFSSPERCVKCIIATKLKYKRRTHFSLYNFVINLLTPVIKKINKIQGLKTKIRSKKDELNELIDTCDNVFLIADWFKEILSKNGYGSPSIKKIPPITKIPGERKEETDWNIKRKILFAGRIEKQKGLHLLCKAMNFIVTEGIQLDVFGNIVDENYNKSCRKEYAFNFKGTLPRSELLKLLTDYDFLILPSVFTEMYSMISQEAFYEHLPVIASAAKGNVDIIKEGKNGFIFDYDNYKDLARVIDHGYALKESGWEPVFETSTLQEDDIREILSYYSF